MMKLLLSVAVLVVGGLTAGCTILTPEERAHYASRLYQLPSAVVFDAVQTRVKQYPMGVEEADLTKGYVTSRIGGTTPGFGANVGYQVRVLVAEEGPKQTRVTPAWQMNVSSEPTKTHLIPVTIDDRPLLYWEFFDDLDKGLSAQR